jgi:AcrR family transcriptional regulator
MRPSKRTELLKASLDVLNQQGIDSLTLDNIAERAGMTRAGLLYHFRDRDNLLTSVYQHVADTWNTALTRLAGKPADQCSDYERLQAQILTGVYRASHADILLMHHAVTNSEVAKPLTDVLRRWSVRTEFADPEKTFIWTTAFLASHGMWMSDAGGEEYMSPADREAYVAALGAWVRTTEPDVAP